MTINPYNQYKQLSILTASPGDLTLMLYDGCLKQMKLARKCIEEKKYMEKNECLQKAQNIIRELMMTLDFSYDIAENFFSIYEFIMRQLVTANIKCDVTLIDESVELLTELRNTWAEAIKIDRKAAYNE